VQVKGVIQPEAITINCAVDACPPRCPLPGHAWSSVVHKDEATWMAFYKDTINGEFKYIFMSAGSSLKGQSDREKFEKARELKKHVGKIRQQITKGLRSGTPLEVQQNVALWLIDNLAIRAGNEKDTSEEADTVGCCSLRCEHITLGQDEEGPTIYFKFLGKDSIEYRNLLKLRPDDEERALAGEEDPCVSFVRSTERENFLQVAATTPPRDSARAQAAAPSRGVGSGSEDALLRVHTQRIGCAAARLWGSRAGARCGFLVASAFKGWTGRPTAVVDIAVRAVVGC
jgi:hypothetical protein